ncbi:MAG: M50 family metallopeptidase [Lachnospira sp.]
MNYKTKIKIEQFLYGILSFVGFGCVGGSVGYFIGTVQKNMEKNMSVITFAVVAISALAVIYLSCYINICLHEIGHMIFGLLTGYKFNSIRFGKLMLVKKNGKLHFCRYNMPGTGGQCLMSAPEGDAEKMPVVLYNLGGLIVNLFLLLIGAGMFFWMKNSHPIVGIVCLVFAMTSFVILITNGIPFMQIGTDGANTIILYKDKNARVAFQKQLEIVNYCANNYSIREMPKELFSFDKSIPMNNPLITAQAVNYYNYLSVNKMYVEAKEMALFILENAKSINQLHEKILYGELIFHAAVIDRNSEAAKELYESHKKELNSASGFISIQRILYAYYTLVERDEKKATTFAKRFENSVKNYPFPKDATIEKEQFDMVAEVLQKKEEFKERPPKL